MSDSLLLNTPALTPVFESKLKMGINDISNQIYHQDRAFLSSSVLKTIAKSLDQYRIEYLEGQKKEHSERTLSNFSEGSYVHSRILEPELTDSEFAIYEGWRKQGKEFEAFKESNPGKSIMSLPQIERCNRMLEAYNRMPEANNLMKDGFSEQTICGILHNVPIKVRFDRINPAEGYIVDIKTTGYGSDIDSFKQTVKDFSYDLSASLYSQMAEAYYGKPFNFYFLVLSKLDFTCNLYVVSEETRKSADRVVSAACSKYRKAVESGIWTEVGAALNKPVERTEYEILEI